MNLDYHVITIFHSLAQIERITKLGVELIFTFVTVKVPRWKESQCTSSTSRAYVLKTPELCLRTYDRSQSGSLVSNMVYCSLPTARIPIKLYILVHRGTHNVMTIQLPGAYERKLQGHLGTISQINSFDLRSEPVRVCLEVLAVFARMR